MEGYKKEFVDLIAKMSTKTYEIYYNAGRGFKVDNWILELKTMSKQLLEMQNIKEPIQPLKKRGKK